jgi:hypothetical protein
MQKLYFFALCILFVTNSNFADIRIVTGVEPPTNYYINNEFGGIVVDLVELIKRDLNLKTSIEVLPWSRAMVIANNENGVVF